MTQFIECKQVVKAYQVDKHEIVALRGIDFAMAQGEMVAIVGPSGAGKSSLLNLLGGLDTPTAGQVQVDGLDILSLKGASLARYRLQKVGFVWQNVAQNLIAYRSALANIMIPMELAYVPRVQRLVRARELLNAVGLGEFEHAYPAQLSGGQQQRVAIAVALANQPDVLLADEPTGSLDEAKSLDIVAMIDKIRQDLNLTVLMVTHSPDVANLADRVLTLRDGALGQDLSDDINSSRLTDEGHLIVPEQIQSYLSDADQIAFEIRPEGILVRRETTQLFDSPEAFDDNNAITEPTLSLGQRIWQKLRRKDNAQ